MAFLQLLFSLWIVFVGRLDGMTPAVTAYFSPDDHLEKRLIEAIRAEKKTVHLCVYNFTHRGVASALIEAKKRGVDVEVIVDQFAIKASSPLHRLLKAAIAVDVWAPHRPTSKKAHRPMMHHNFCIFGSEVVWTGSFSFTYESARLHQEDVVVMHDSVLAERYKDHFYTIKHRSCTPLALFLTTRPHKKPKK